MAIELVVDLASIVWMCKRLLWVVEVGGSDSAVDSFIGKVDDWVVSVPMVVVDVVVGKGVVVVVVVGGVVVGLIRHSPDLKSHS